MNFEAHNVLITGGAGFIGTQLRAPWLARTTAGNVVVFDELTYAGHLENLAGLRA